MSTFKDIVGQEQLKEHLENAIQLNKVSHAYIINGERSSGKEFIAKTFAMALQCENRQGTEPCQECHSCKQALSSNHPDIIFISHEKPNTISVDDIRSQINGDVAIKPYSGPKKIYIMNEGEKMTVQAQNALLKTLEEPPEYAVIIILTSNVNAFLPTIVSRCVVLNMKPVKDEQIKKFLMEEMEIPSYKADICVAFARGNVGKARLLAKSEEFDKVKASCGFAPESAEIIRSLKDRGLRVILATNPIFPAQATRWRIRWAGMKPEDFDLVTTYENSCHCKPNTDYYRDILEQFGLKGEECVMVGNDVQEDMIARTLGMKVFLLTPCLINRDDTDINQFPHGGYKELSEFLLNI